MVSTSVVIPPWQSYNCRGWRPRVRPASVTILKSPDTIQLVILDIDGVLSEGEGQPLALELLGLLASPNSAARAAPAWGPLPAQVDLVYSTSCLNVLPHGIDKGLGVGGLAERTGIPLAVMLGGGGSGVGLP